MDNENIDFIAFNFRSEYLIKVRKRTVLENYHSFCWQYFLKTHIGFYQNPRFLDRLGSEREEKMSSLYLFFGGDVKNSSK
jgi:hypothetical protein